MQLVVITPENDFAHETETVNALFRAGLDRLHLRKPAYQHVDYQNYIEAIAPAYRQKIVIHGAWHLYANQMAGGIHLRSELRKTGEAAGLLGSIPRQAVSTSFHSWDEVTALGTGYGSIFISPLFDSISKQGYKAAVQPEGIISARAILTAQNKPCPQIIGLGGIGNENILGLKTLGYDGAALLGAIWQTPYPVQAFETIKRTVSGSTS